MSKMTTQYAGLVVLLFSMVLPRHVVGGVEAGGVLVFRDARVFDGAQMLPRASVLVQNGRIAAVGPQVQAPDGAHVIEGRGKTLLPGLIDSHTHVFFPVSGLGCGTLPQRKVELAPDSG